MKISKKLLSLLLAVVMLISTFTVLASAYTVGNEVADAINLKYTVEKATSATCVDTDSVYEGDDLYAVTIWAKAQHGIDTLQATIHFNESHYDVLYYIDGEDLYISKDTFYADNSGDAMDYVYTLGDGWNNDGLYKNDGSTATKKQATVIGLGNDAATAPALDFWYISADHPYYSDYQANLPANTGVLTCIFDNAQTAKTAYFNVTSGIVVNTDWVKMLTVYFVRAEGVTDADCVGDEFGAYVDNAKGYDGTTDASGAPALNVNATYVAGTPDINVVSNAVVEAAAEPTIVNPLKGQIRFDKDANGAYAGTFDVRALATITEADFKATFTDATTAEKMIKEIGFVFASGENVGTPDMPGVKALVENGTALSGYKKKTVDYISTGATNVEAGNYVFSCIVEDIPEADKADNLVAVGYIAWDSDNDGAVDTYNYYPSAQEISFNALYTAHYNSAFPQA